MNTKVLKDYGEAVIDDIAIDINFPKEKVEENTYSFDEEKNIQNLDIHKKTNKISVYANLFVKRIIDIVGSVFGIAILIPLTALVAILNFINNEKGPIFYSQKRIGKDGKYFRMYKFRTMVIDADKKLEYMLKNNEDMRKEWEENRKLKDDPRITKIGKILRKTSLDEWPQFINVFLGQMSLVGPRAVIDGEIEKFGIYKKDVLSVKPGITGYWTANGRSNTTYEERVFMEYKYVREFSVWMDIKILFKTVISVVKKEGAV